jgi:putative ABC transport system permease protein
LLKDCWRNLRTIFNTPVLSLVIVATLALGFGANIAIFSVLRSVVMRGFPYRDAGRVALVWMTNPQLGYSEYFMSSPDLRDLAAENRSFETMGHYGFGFVNLTGSGTPEALLGAWIAPNLLSDLGATTVVGRLFLEDETRAEHERAVVIGYGLWQRRFGASRDIVGRAITLNRQIYTIVGVTAREFSGPPGFDIGGTVSDQKPELWVPLNLARKELGTLDLTQRSNRWATVIARLRPGVSITAAQREMSVAAGRLAQRYPESNKGWGIEVRGLREQSTAGIRTSLWLLMAAAGCVLLLASANVAIILVARIAARGGEMGIRAALGASRGRLIGQLLTESLMYAVLGGIAALFLGYAGVLGLKAVAPANVPRMTEAGMDSGVLLFMLLLILATSAIVGMVPAWRASGASIADALRSSGRGAMQARQGLLEAFVMVQFAVTCTLLIAAGLLAKSFYELHRLDPGFQPEHVSSGSYYLPSFSYPSDASRALFVKKLTMEMAGKRGVESVGAIDWLPFSGDEFRQTFEVEGRPAVSAAERPQANYRSVTPEYFRTLGIPLRAGRVFRERDDQSSPPVLMVNETLARRFFGGENPLGRRVNLEERPAKPVWREIVGVVGDVKHLKLNEPRLPDVYVPLLQKPVDLFTVVARTRLDAPAFGSLLRRATGAVDPNEPINEIDTMTGLIARSMATEQLQTAILGSLGAAALLLALAGVGGMTLYSVVRQTREIGIRLALGASRGRILQRVLGRALRIVAIGGGVGGRGESDRDAIDRKYSVWSEADRRGSFCGCAGVASRRGDHGDLYASAPGDRD